jgi:hypothetical protein
MRFNLNENDALIGSPSGSNRAISRQFQQFSAMGACFPPLAHHFHYQIRHCKLHPVPAVHMSHLLRDFAMHCFDSKLAFDLLGKRQAANCSCFRHNAVRTKIVRGLVENYGVMVAEVARQMGISTSGVSKILMRTLSTCPPALLAANIMVRYHNHCGPDALSKVTRFSPRN